MRISIFILCLFILNGFGACKTSKKAEKNSTDSTTDVGSQNKEKEEVFRLSVSFYSIGAGTDGSAIDKFNNFLKGYSPQLNYEASRWGREGEVNYCFQLKELKSDSQKSFINEVKKILKDCQLVHIEENKSCIKRR